MLSKVVIVLFIVLLLVREWSWRSYEYRQNERIKDLDSEIEHALLRLHIADTIAAENYTCNANDNKEAVVEKPIAEMSLIEFEDLVTTRREKAYNDFKLKGIVNKKLIIRSHVLDVVGMIQIGLLAVMGLLEIQYGHSVIYSEKNEDSSASDIDFQGNRVYRRFISHRLPLSGFAVNFVIWSIGLVTWLNFIDRNIFVPFALRLILHWLLASRVVFWVTNIIILRKYLHLPSIYNFEELKLKLLDFHWWFWLVSKIIAPDGVWTLVRLVLSLYLAIPIRYFYYFCSTCHFKTAATIDDIGSSWFLVNMILHISALGWWTCLLRLNAFGTPTWFRLFKTDNLKVLLGMGILNVISGVFCLFRVFHFAYYASCSWWGSVVTFIFFHIFIVEIVESLPHILSLIGKDDYLFLIIHFLSHFYREVWHL